PPIFAMQLTTVATLRTASALLRIPSYSLDLPLLGPLLHSFPTRRSSDLSRSPAASGRTRSWHPTARPCPFSRRSRARATASRRVDRKSTRLNSSHQIISYAVFCLKKKNRLPRCTLFHSQ